MRIENCTFRVNKHSAATEVFISNDKGVNTVLYLPADTEVDVTTPLEFIPAPPPPAKKAETGTKPTT